MLFSASYLTTARIKPESRDTDRAYHPIANTNQHPDSAGTK